MIQGNGAYSESLGVVICATPLIPLGMGKLQFDEIRVPASFIEGRRCHGLHAVAGHLFAGIPATAQCGIEGVVANGSFAATQ
jgi:hypothetical protein